MLPQQNQDQSARTPLVVTYHPILPTFLSTTKHHLSILHTSERLRRAFPLPPLIVFRTPRKLKDLLVRATLIPIVYELPGNHPRGAPRCKTCPILLAMDEFSSSITGEQFKVKSKASCKSSNIIYLIKCRRCGQQYVRETGQALHRRINSHRHDIVHRRTDESPVAEHFNGDAHSLADMTVMVIDQMRSRDPCLQKV